jgi:hypothetical protein
MSAAVCLNELVPSRPTPLNQHNQPDADTVMFGPHSAHAPEPGTVRLLPWACTARRDRVSMSGGGLDGHVR